MHVNSGRVARVYREEACDTKVSSMVASTTSFSRQFQSFIVLGKKEVFMYCFLAGVSLNCLVTAPNPHMH